jgi:uncharacterized protein
MYHDGARRWQDHFRTRALADRLVDVTLHAEFTDDDRLLIEGCSMFFLATADADGHPECSFKGGPRGFVRVLDPQTLAFPSYDGNGMFKSLGNVLVNPNVGLLFVDFERQRRVRVNGTATVSETDALLADFTGAQLVVRVRATQIFPNCPRYIPKLAIVEPSPYAPAPGCTPPIPEWKRRPVFQEVLPPGDPARSAPPA